VAHLRNQIRDAVITALTGLSTTGSNVFRSRIYPLESNKIPGLCVFSKSEATTFDTLKRPRSINRVLEIGVEAYVKGTTGYDNTIDQICLEIEEALYANRTLGGNAQDVMITGFEADFNGDGDQPVSRATLTIEVQYQTLEDNPDVAV